MSSPSNHKNLILASSVEFIAKFIIKSSIFDSFKSFIDIIDTSFKRSLSEKFVIINEDKKREKKEKEKNNGENEKIKNNNKKDLSIFSYLD